MKTHKIGWLNVPGYIPQTWNPIVGCSKVSEGCRNCYAERMAFRICRMMEPPKYTAYRGVLYADSAGGAIEKWNGETTLLEDILQKPLGWKKPRAIFVNSMGDLFHENTPDEWIQQVFRVMSLCPQHLFIVLTKRADRMEKFIHDRLARFKESGLSGELPHVWLGVTVEDQEAADERIPHLLSTPAAVRFVSCEPLIGPVDLSTWIPPFNDCSHYQGGCVRPENVFACTASPESRPGTESCKPSQCVFGRRGIDWIIAGGESGANQEVRPGHAEWFRSLRDQAEEAGVPFFFKQWGNPAAYAFSGFNRQCEAGLDKTKRTGGDMLDGQQHHQWPVSDKSGV